MLIFPIKTIKTKKSCGPCGSNNTLLSPCFLSLSFTLFQHLFMIMISSTHAAVVACVVPKGVEAEAQDSSQDLLY